MSKRETVVVDIADKPETKSDEETVNKSRGAPTLTANAGPAVPDNDARKKKAVSRNGRQRRFHVQISLPLPFFFYTSNLSISSQLNSHFSAKCHVCKRQRVRDPSDLDVELSEERTAGMTREGEKRERRKERERDKKEERERELQTAEKPIAMKCQILSSSSQTIPGQMRRSQNALLPAAALPLQRFVFHKLHAQTEPRGCSQVKRSGPHAL